MTGLLMVMLLGMLLAQELNPIQEQVSAEVDSGSSSSWNTTFRIGYRLSHLDSPLVDIVWCGTPGQTDAPLLVLSEKGSVYRSEDQGQTWTKKTEQFQQLAYVEIEEDESTGVVQKLMVSPVDTHLVLFVGSHGVNWRSPDCGKTLVAMNHGRAVSEFQFHPTKRDVLLAVAWSRCEDYEDEPCRLQKELYVTFNLGDDWKLIEDYVVQFAWAYLDHSFRGLVHQDRIILAHEPKGTGHQNITHWNKNVHLSYSDNFFKTRVPMLKYGNKFLLTKRFLYAVQVRKENKQEINLLVANPRALSNYAFVSTEFPFGHLKEKSYTILESEANSVFLNVNHQGDQARFGHLYISDAQGKKFSLAMAHHARDTDGTCDFEKVLSLEGIYLINSYESSVISKYRKQSTTKFDLESYKKTKISFNNGASWEGIQAPEQDSRGRDIQCKEGCGLHFHTVTSSDMYGAFYSTDKAIGLIIATGNVGHSLSRQKGQVNTYLSRDGGRHWSELMKGSHIYEIGDHGGILLMASDEQPTNTLFYSWNEGGTWHSFTFSSNKLKVSNIITEPSNSALSFVLYGKDEQDQGVMVSLDFSAFHTQQCKGLDIPDHENSDYELWNVRGTDHNECQLGRKETVVRKKTSSTCFNGQAFDKILFKEHCKCTPLDYECDTGYSREANGPCRLTNSTKTGSEYMQSFWEGKDTTQVIDNCTDYYYIPSGYRKIPGDVCRGGVTYDPVKIPCPKAITDINDQRQQEKHRRLVIGSGIVMVILLILYFRGHTLLTNTKTMLQNIMFLFNRTRFDYSQFEETDSEVDFSKMVFGEEQE